MSSSRSTYFSHLDGIVKALPHKPGVYQFLDDKNRIIYVGKAKDLKKRVSSYFSKINSISGKVQMLVRKIADIRYIVVSTEQDALLLENNLIKKYRPRYNVALKDDKTFPWICVKNEPFPRIFPTRSLIRDGSEFFGPYANVRLMHTLLGLIRQLFPLRNCSLNLSDKNIRAGKFKICLEYHIGNCKGPCVGFQSMEDYDLSVQGIRNIIKGNVTVVTRQLKELMMDYAARQEFEKAHLVKERYLALEKYQSKSTVVNPGINDVDVFSIISDVTTAYVNFMKVMNGAIIQVHTIEIQKKLDEPDEELLPIAITDIRERFESGSPEVIVPFDPGYELSQVVFTVPKIGDKKKLLELSQRNVRYYQLEKEKQKEMVDPEHKSRRILETMRKDLRMSELPEHIECFDNSNIHGDFPVAAMVCFKQAKPDKTEYRHFNIKTVEGPNDYASMEEIVYRRYKRLLEENRSLPQLIIVDGGKGQLSAAMSSLKKLKLTGNITIIGIAKKLEEIYYPHDPLPMYLDKKSETLRIIQQMRDEAHRFGITHHRKRREKGTVRSVLTDIPGIGYSTTQQLLWKFKSVKRIREASLEELQEVIGKAKAKLVFEFFNRSEPPSV
ncbi:MAG: excinuclease ABC subunit UvrC [Bacteroidetes bacterium]|nr:MAG: excinuclease ABC subunit UvrC [Bacteroidota bacterium]